MISIKQERHLIIKRREGKVLDKQIGELQLKRDRHLLELDLLTSYYHSADSAPES